MKKNILLFIFLALAITGLSYFFIAKRAVSTKGVHYHAGFIVFDNGKKVDFSDIKYMTIKPCKLKNSETDTSEDLQNEKAHLHDKVGDVVHVEAEGAKWGDLFSNIGYPIDYSKATAYINHQKVDDIKDYPIKAYDSLVIFIGKVDTQLLDEAVTRDHILQIEKTSEICGD